MSGAPTIEAELGQQLYEDVYINKIYKGGNGPADGGYDRLRTIREFQLRVGGTFLHGQERVNAFWSGEYEVLTSDRGWLKGGEYPVGLYYYRLKPGSQRKKVGKQPSTKDPTQKPLTQDDPETIPSEGSKNCRFTISFKSGTFYDNNRALPNGPGEIRHEGRTYVGLGFTVSGSTRGGGGIGRIGAHANPSNPNGEWNLDQFTSSYAKQDGEFVKIQGRIQQGGEAWRDIDLRGYYFATDWSNRFTRYDHPALPPNPTTYKNQSFLIKVYRGREVCQAEFHVIQRGNTIHWGRGARGIWPQ
jgi:hypothetical protein